MVLHYEDVKEILKENAVQFSELPNGELSSIFFFSEYNMIYLDFYDKEKGKIKGLLSVTKRKNNESEKVETVEEYFSSLGDYLALRDSDNGSENRNVFLLYTKEGVINISLKKIKKNEKLILKPSFGNNERQKDKTKKFIKMLMEKKGIAKC